MTGWDNIDPPEELTIKIFPGADNAFDLYEDDGLTTAYQQGEFALTHLQQQWRGDELTFTLTPPAADFDFLPRQRTYTLIFLAVNAPEKIILRQNDVPFEFPLEFPHAYDAQKHTLTISGLPLEPGSTLTIQLVNPSGLLDQTDWRPAMLERFLKVFKLNSYAKQRLHGQLAEFLADPTLLLGYTDYLTHSQLLAFIETWLGTQPQVISSDPDEAFNRIINQLYRH
jgi:hypothetical protein